MLLHYLGKVKVQLFCRYAADIEEYANKLHLCTDFNSPTRVTVYAKCILCVNRIIETLSIRRHDYFLFTARSAAAWLPVNCVCVPQLFSTAFYFLMSSGNSSVNLFAVYPFKYKLFIKILSSLLNTMLSVDKHCSDVCCDEFSVPQTDRKSKQV